MQVQSISIFLVVFIPFFLSYNVFSSNEALIIINTLYHSLTEQNSDTKQTVVVLSFKIVYLWFILLQLEPTWTNTLTS